MERQLDIEVARALGYGCWKFSANNVSWYQLLRPELSERWEDSVRVKARNGVLLNHDEWPDPSEIDDLPAWSTDVGLAWRLVDEMYSMEYYIKINCQIPLDLGKKWRCAYLGPLLSDDGYINSDYVWAESVEVAICKVFLIVKALPEPQTLLP